MGPYLKSTCLTLFETKGEVHVLAVENSLDQLTQTGRNMGDEQRIKQISYVCRKHSVFDKCDKLY